MKLTPIVCCAHGNRCAGGEVWNPFKKNCIPLNNWVIKGQKKWGKKVIPILMKYDTVYVSWRKKS